MPRKRVAIVQSSYIPWKGYFDLIRAADEFILLDDVQFTKRDWRSRNRIKTKDGLAWLTVPVETKGRFLQRIDEVTISDGEWGRRHWATIQSAYARTPFFAQLAPLFEPLFREPGTSSLSRVNHAFITAICKVLGVTTPIRWSTEFTSRPDRNGRLIDLCIATGASDYLSGPSAREYIDMAAWTTAGVSVHFVDYTNYPEYPQPYPPFEHGVSALDLLFCTGPRALDHMKDLAPAPTRA
jgi:WbqC-like protein